MSGERLDLIGDQLYLTGDNIAATDYAIVFTATGPRRILLADYNNSRTVQQAFTISSAQVLALNATPISILAAPGASYSWIVEGIQLYTPGGTAYAGIAAGEDLAFSYGAAGVIMAEVETTGWLDQTSAQARYAYPIVAAAVQPVNSITPVINTAIYARLLVGEITTGNYPIYGRIWARKILHVLSGS